MDRMRCSQREQRYEEVVIISRPSSSSHLARGSKNIEPRYEQQGGRTAERQNVFVLRIHEYKYKISWHKEARTNMDFVV
jgi:hypothetical protein